MMTTEEKRSYLCNSLLKEKEAVLGEQFENLQCLLGERKLFSDANNIQEIDFIMAYRDADIFKSYGQIELNEMMKKLDTNLQDISAIDLRDYMHFKRDILQIPFKSEKSHKYGVDVLYQGSDTNSIQKDLTALLDIFQDVLEHPDIKITFKLSLYFNDDLISNAQIGFSDLNFCKDLIKNYDPNTLTTLLTNKELDSLSIYEGPDMHDYVKNIQNRLSQLKHVEELLENNMRLENIHINLSNEPMQIAQ